MWTLTQIEEAFGLFKQAAPGTELEVWFCDRGLCIFKVPEELPASIHQRVEALNWSLCSDPNEFGERCWYLFRSD